MDDIMKIINSLSMRKLRELKRELDKTISIKDADTILRLNNKELIEGIENLILADPDIKQFTIETADFSFTDASNKEIKRALIALGCYKKNKRVGDKVIRMWHKPTKYAFLSADIPDSDQ